MISVTVSNQMHSCHELELEWQALAGKGQGEGIMAMSACNSFPWAVSLWKIHLEESAVCIMRAEEAGQVLAILPCYVGKSGRGLKTLFAFQELYGDRPGLLCQDDRPDALVSLLTARHQGSPAWNRLILRVIEGSSGQHTLEQALHSADLRFSTEYGEPSAYIELPILREHYYASLGGKFRKKLNQRARHFSELGDVTFNIYEKPDDVPSLLEDISTIEMSSWKEKAGMSITKKPVQMGFYCSFLPEAAARGWLLSAVLKIDGRPIAYQLGLSYNATYECLKTSYAEEFAKHGPGKELTRRLIDLLYERGIAYCDFQGVIDEFKATWTSRTYRTVRYTIYAKTIVSELTRITRQIRDWIYPRNRNRPVWH